MSGFLISAGYYGYGDRWPTKGFHLGLVLFDREGKALFVIPSNLSHYKRIKEWIEGSHPLKGEPSLPKI